MSSDTLLKLTNFLLFQVGWLACVLLTNYWALLVAAVILAVHLKVISTRPRSEARFILLGIVLGSLLDGLWFRFGVLADSAGTAWTPLWLAAIWALFMTTLSHSLVWMHQRAWLPFVLTPVAGPFAYFAASQLDAVSLPMGPTSLVALAVGWLVIFPLLMTIQKLHFPETLA